MDLPAELVDYLAARRKDRSDRAWAVIDLLTEPERQLADRCAEVGYAQGFAAGRAGAPDVGNFPKLPLVLAQAEIDRLNGFEHHLATACAVMGYVQGFNGGRLGESDVGSHPKLPLVISHCTSMPDLYPVIATLDDGLRPDDEGFMERFRYHAGLDRDEEAA